MFPYGNIGGFDQLLLNLDAKQKSRIEVLKRWPHRDDEESVEIVCWRLFLLTSNELVKLGVE